MSKLGRDWGRIVGKGLPLEHPDSYPECVMKPRTTYSPASFPGFPRQAWIHRVIHR
jgi:hypothetical protein